VSFSSPLPINDLVDPYYAKAMVAEELSYKIEPNTKYYDNLLM